MPKKTTPMSIMKMETICSKGEFGVTSPYPIVETVTVTKCREATYCCQYGLFTSGWPVPSPKIL